MDRDVFEHVKKYNRTKGWPETEAECVDVIRCAKKVYKDEGERHRWYVMHEKVVVIDGMYIGFREPETHLENSDIPGIDVESIKQYEPRPEMVVVYYPME